MTKMEFAISKDILHQKMMRLNILYQDKYTNGGFPLQAVATFLGVYQSAVEGERITAISLVSYMELANKHWKILREME